MSKVTYLPPPPKPQTPTHCKYMGCCPCDVYVCRNVRLSFSFVYPDRRGQNVMKEVRCSCLGGGGGPPPSGHAHSSRGCRVPEAEPHIDRRHPKPRSAQCPDEVAWDAAAAADGDGGGGMSVVAAAVAVVLLWQLH